MTTSDTTEAGKVIRVGNHALIPIERTIIVYEDHESVGWSYAAKRLVGLIVRSPSGDQAFELETGPVSIEEIWPHPIERWVRVSDHAD